jgi:hypothetical protein
MQWGGPGTRSNGVVSAGQGPVCMYGLVGGIGSGGAGSVSERGWIGY